MKKKMIFLFLICLSYIACSQEKEVKLLDKIAHDPLNISYSALVMRSADMVALNEYDMKEVHKLNEKYEGFSFCDVPEPSYEKIRGGKEYFELHCEMELLADKLKAKYPEYIKLSKDDFGYLGKIYREKYYKQDQEKLEKIQNRYAKSN